MRRFATFYAFALALASANAQTCPPDAAQKTAATALSIQRTLQASSVPTMDTDVPEPLRPLLHNFKQTLIETVETALRCNSVTLTEPTAIKSSLASLLPANLPEKPFVPTPAGTKWPETEKGTYGTDLAIEVKPILGQSGLISIQVTYGIECGNDNILLLYRRSAGTWKRELLWQNPDLNSISDAFGGFFLYPLVAPDKAHPYFIAVAHGTNWCTSNISDFDIDLLAPAQGGKPQTRLDHLGSAYRREDEVIVKTTTDGFQLRATANSLATAIIMRPGVFRYRTTGGKLERIQPIANNARDFVDEWLQIPWPEAARWSAEPLPALKAAHDRFDYKLHPGTDDKNGTPSIDAYGPVRACTAPDRRFQVEIDLSDTPKLYAIVRQDPAAFTMLSIGSQPDAACHGRDIMKPR